MSGGRARPLEASAAGAREPRPAEVRIGPLTVRTGAGEVAAFARALGSRPTYGPVPLTFPVRWLSLPGVRGDISRALGLDQTPLVQQSQTFRYAEPLECEREYAFEVAASCPSPDRTVLHAAVSDTAGNDVLAMETVLRALHMVPTRSTREIGRRTTAAEDGAVLLRADPFDLAQTQRYAAASLDHNPLHSDIGAARAAGLNGLTVHGMMVMGQFESALVAWRQDLRVVRLYGIFLRPLPAGSQIAVSGRVAKTSRDSSGEQLILRLVARTAEGDAVCVGEAAATSGRAGAGRGRG